MRVERVLQDLIGPSIDHHRTFRRLAIEPAHVAAGFVEAHEVVHLCDGRKCCVDCCIKVGWVLAGDDDLDERAEQRTGATDAIGRVSHRRSISF